MMNQTYTASAPSRADIDALDGAVVLEFGTGWCGHCRAADALLEPAFASHAAVRHVRIEDGSGRPLGRSFGVKLWPTLIFLQQGREVARLVRPADAGQVEQAFALLAP